MSRKSIRIWDWDSLIKKFPIKDVNQSGDFILDDACVRHGMREIIEERHGQSLEITEWKNGVASLKNPLDVNAFTIERIPGIVIMDIQADEAYKEIYKFEVFFSMLGTGRLYYRDNEHAAYSIIEVDKQSSGEEIGKFWARPGRRVYQLTSTVAGMGGQRNANR